MLGALPAPYLAHVAQSFIDNPSAVAVNLYINGRPAVTVTREEWSLDRLTRERAAVKNLDAFNAWRASIDWNSLSLAEMKALLAEYEAKLV